MVKVEEFIHCAQDNVVDLVEIERRVDL